MKAIAPLQNSGAILLCKKGIPAKEYPFYSVIGLLLLELILAYAAERADKIIGNVLPGSSGSYAAVRLAGFGIIDITADRAYIFHRDDLLCYDTFIIPYPGRVVIHHFGKRINS